MRRLVWSVATTLLLAPAALRAAEVPVTYLVDAKTFGDDAVAGTPLTFTLHTDASCTTPLRTKVVNVENLDLIEKVRLITPKNAPKTPAPARLFTTVSGVPVSGNLYLMVTGTGVSPVGGACQPQAA